MISEIYISGIKHDSIVDGDGLRNVIFVSGCWWSCKDCHNPTTHIITNGTKMKIEDVVNDVLSDDNDITLSGGDSLTYQIDSTIELLYQIKSKRPNINIWCYTGYEWETMINIPKIKIALQYIDVVVDGKFIEELKDSDLLFRGSSNQRIINVKESLIQNKVVLLYD